MDNNVNDKYDEYKEISKTNKVTYKTTYWSWRERTGRRNIIRKNKDEKREDGVNQLKSRSGTISYFISDL